MEMNKKDLKKMMYSFNTISSRMMRVKWDEYNMVLKKFINFIYELFGIVPPLKLFYHKKRKNDSSLAISIIKY